MRSLVFAVLMVSFASTGFAQDDLDESKTYVVIAGVLQWSGGLSSFPTKHRKDEELYETLKARGVPETQMKLLLDDDATFSKIRAAIRDVAGKAPKDATLVFYYCGHGMPAGKDDFCFANYDLDTANTKKTGLLVSDIGNLIEKHFKGQRVLLLADCCYSGGLAKAARSLKKSGYEAASITSSTDAVTSTRNWTFTQTIIDGLKGETFGDADGDGALSLAELAAEVGGAMQARENQPAGSAFEGWAKEFKIAAAPRREKPAEGSAFKLGDYVIAQRTGGSPVGRITAIADEALTVEFYDYSDKSHAPFAPDKLVSLAEYKAKRATLEKATHEVEWHGHWYKASVIKRDGEKSYIHYVGYGPEWDEWAAPERVRALPFDGQ